MRGIPNPRIVLPEQFELASTGFNCYFAIDIEFQHINYDKYLPATAAAKSMVRRNRHRSMEPCCAIYKSVLKSYNR